MLPGRAGPACFTRAESAHRQGTDALVGRIQVSEDRFVANTLCYGYGASMVLFILVHRAVSFL